MSQQDANDNEANAVMVYECPDGGFLGLYYDERSDGEVLFQEAGATIDQVVDKMVTSLNDAPRRMDAVANDEAELVDVVPLARTEDGGEA